MTTETLSFGTDVGRLLDIVANALYSNKDVFLRELISNSSDACDRLRYELVSNKKIKANKDGQHIRIFVDTDKRTVSIIDSGIGMDRQDLIDNLGTIAKSGTGAIMDELSKTKDSEKSLNLIGQFGVGFYASFMVSNKVDVISKKIGTNETNVWSSDGKTGFTLEAATDEQAALIDQSGTVINLHIKDEACEYLIEPKLKEIIETWADHVEVPIYLGKPIDEDSDEVESPVNAASALWARPKSDVTEQDYKGFFSHISSGFNIDEPLMTTHWTAEGVIEYTGLLFTPSMRPWDLFDASRKHAVKLYVKRVFITDDCSDLMYPWLRFLRGVIDSQDLPLNISREMLQHNPVIDKIRNGVAKKVLRELDDLSRNEQDKFLTFWQQFGSVIKEGLYDAMQHQADILKICRFYSTKSDIEVASLSDYVGRMQDGQEDIYYISGENIETLKNSPQLEGFKARDIEVLLFKDTIDDFWLQSVNSYEGKKFVSVTKGAIDLDNVGSDKDKTKNKEKKKPKTTKKVEDLLTLIKETLADDVSDVTISTRLTSSPSCLIAGENEVDLKMERILKNQQQYDAESKRILEINGDHTLIKKLAGNPANDHVKDAAYLLLDQAKIALGEPVDNPTEFARRLNYFIESGS